MGREKIESMILTRFATMGRGHFCEHQKAGWGQDTVLAQVSNQS